jgi:hypothetical protein
VPRPFFRTSAVVLLLASPLHWLVAGCGGEGGYGTPGLTPAPDDPATVLRTWDEARSDAWAAGDAAALGALYVSGSAVGRRDVGLLRSYDRRGLRVSGLRFQRLAVRVLADDTGVLRLEVVERLLPARVSDGAVDRRLPGGQPVRRVIELRQVQGAWRVARVVTP